MIKGGKGGAKTLTGLKFETRSDLKSKFAHLPGYVVRGDELYFNGQRVAIFYKKGALYKKFLEPQGVSCREIISKQLLPDDAILVLSGKTLFIVEMKFQAVSGSVDEKLQTCDFKNKQYRKLLTPLGMQVKYTYVLNDWFKKPEYRDVLEYIKSVGCYYFFEELPLEHLGLPHD